MQKLFVAISFALWLVPEVPGSAQPFAFPGAEGKQKLTKNNWKYGVQGEGVDRAALDKSMLKEPGLKNTRHLSREEAKAS